MAELSKKALYSCEEIRTSVDPRWLFKMAIVCGHEVLNTTLYDVTAARGYSKRLQVTCHKASLLMLESTPTVVF